MKHSEQITLKLQNKLEVMHQQYQAYAATRQECALLQQRLEEVQRKEFAADKEQQLQAAVRALLKDPQLANEIARIADRRNR